MIGHPEKMRFIEDACRRLTGDPPVQGDKDDVALGKIVDALAQGLWWKELYYKKASPDGPREKTQGS